MIKTRKVIFAFNLLAVILLSACATTPPVNEGDMVAEKAGARWDALLSRDYAGAYSYYSPGYRSAVSATDFEIEYRLRRVRWISAEYLEHECDENTCTVKFKMGYQVKSPVPGVDSFSGYDVSSDQWIKTGGEWWYLPDEG